MTCAFWCGQDMAMCVCVCVPRPGATPKGFLTARGAIVGSDSIARWGRHHDASVSCSELEVCGDGGRPRRRDDLQSAGWRKEKQSNQRRKVLAGALALAENQQGNDQLQPPPSNVPACACRLRSPGSRPPPKSRFTQQARCSCEY